MYFNSGLLLAEDGLVLLALDEPGDVVFVLVGIQEADYDAEYHYIKGFVKYEGKYG